ncbi:MAG: YraN family protein [Pseudomonadota bacterium]|nr:YraN family protein [Pseudomonadota bacterium]
MEGNYNTRFGEIDLIIPDGDNVVFVEVRQRTSSRVGTFAGTENKQKHSVCKKRQHITCSELTGITAHLVGLMLSLLRLIVRTHVSTGSTIVLRPRRTRWIPNTLSAIISV